MWRFNSKTPWTSVENASLNALESDGWRGYAGEGGLILNLIKAASFVEMPSRLRGVFIEAIFCGNMDGYDKKRIDALVDNILRADTAQISRISRRMAAPRREGGFDCSMLDFFPNLKEWHFIECFQSISATRLHSIAKIFATDPYEYRKGWPDLTLWRDGAIAFKEVKAPGDKLHASQKNTIENLLLPLEFPVSIVDIVPVELAGNY
jgi:hypothetical protein